LNNYPRAKFLWPGNQRPRNIRRFANLATRAQFPRQDSNLHLPLLRRSNRSLHHRPNPTFQELAGEPTRRADSGHDVSRYFVLQDYAPVPGTLIPRTAAALRVVQWREVSHLFTTGETFSSLCTKITLVREQAATAELSPTRIRTSQPEGCFTQRSIRSQSPLTVS
jgi:hypothetical protein